MGKRHVKQATALVRSSRHRTAALTLELPGGAVLDITKDGIPVTENVIKSVQDRSTLVA